MAKTKGDMIGPRVNFTLHGDAMTPHPAPWGFIARSPVGFGSGEDGTWRQLDLGVEVDAAALVFPTRAYQHQVRPVKQVFSPGERLIVEVTGALDAGEPVLCVHPLLFG